MERNPQPASPSHPEMDGKMNGWTVGGPATLPTGWVLPSFLLPTGTGGGVGKTGLLRGPPRDPTPRMGPCPLLPGLLLVGLHSTGLEREKSPMVTRTHASDGRSSVGGALWGGWRGPGRGVLTWASWAWLASSRASMERILSVSCEFCARASSSRGARPAPLRAPARPTQPLEPILIPKLRIRLADFPYLHCSNMPEAVHLGDLLRIWVRPGARFTPSPPDFQGPARAHRTPPEPRRFPRHGPLSRGEPIPGRPALHKEKRTLPGAPAGFSGIGCVTALDASRRPSPPLRIRGSEPDSLSIG